ncbi:MAG TPA: hypothetical protein IAB49_05250 [Candidatus Caccenecus avistercoris]|nr:hypothetical protein [Candidatus Caccenecus avistercoris]
MNFEVIKRSHVKRNILIGVIIVLILSAVILTFTRAKYRITKSLPLVNGTINYELSDFNLIGAYIQTKGDNYTQVDEIPASGYEFNAEKSYCTVNEENINATLNYDMETQTLSVVPLTTKGTKCYLYFDEVSSASDIIEDAYEENQDMLAYDEHNNLRYIGANPNNYVSFNDELWRIIGIFNDDTHGIAGQKLIKIIRSESLGDLHWNTSDVGNWSTSSLQVSLNNSYLNGSELGNGKGLSETARNMTETVTWKLGGAASYTSVSDGLASHWYGYERGTKVYSGNPTIWQGKIGLMYPSDYGYATSGGSTTNREACLATALYNWNSSSYSYCKNNDWLYNNDYQWTLTMLSSSPSTVFIVYNSGKVETSSINLYASGAVRPSVYLKANVSILSGDGTRANPYTLDIN